MSFLGYSQGEARNQGHVFPVSRDELTPAEHLVRVIEAQVASLKVREMDFSKASGRPA
ncbi:hypothetical protein [Pseudomonas sp. 2FG]|uniref:hypothetical protein n=1 Tax=Pseudomonas sp. 2FG TaxID=2502191 RepID=UPI0014856802